MRPFVVAVLLASTTAHVTAQNSISITGADRPSAATFAVITINGNGFDAANGAISVVFSARDAIPVTVPAVTATATSLQVAVPPLIGTANGNLFDTPVVTEIQVVQVTSSSVMTSNTIGGLSVEPAPEVGGAAGSFTRAFLRTVLDVQTDLRGAHRSTAAFAGVVSASQAFSDAQRPLLDAVEAIVADAERTINLPTRDQLPLSVSARTLRTADRVAAAFVRQANAEAATRAASPAAEVPAGCRCNATTEAEEWLCDFRRNPCVAHETARKVVPELAVGVYGAQFGFLAGWAAGGLAGASLVASETASALGFLSGQAISYGTAVLAGVDPPGAWSLLRDSGSTLLDDLTDNGLGVFSGLNTGISLGQTIESVVTSTRGQLPSAPRGGVVMSASEPANPPANTRPSVVYSAGQGARWIATAATQQVTSLLNALLPAPATARFDGSYTGNSTATCTVTVPDAPPITSSASGPIAATVANGVVNAGGEGAGTVSPTGRFTAPAISAGGVSCSTGGRFWLDENGGAGATGFIACSGSGVGCSGTWNVTRSR